MRKKVSIRGSLLGEIEKRKVVKEGKCVTELRFILFKSRGNKYIRCVFYSDENLNYKNGDLMCVFGNYLTEEEKNFLTLLEMVDASEVREEDENFKNAIDMMFDVLEEREPNHFAVKQYRKYKLAAGKTAKSILISCGARLAL